MTVSASGRIGRAGGCPTIRAGIVSPAGVENVAAIKSAPDDHFTASPHCRVKVSGSGCVGGAGGCPTIRAGIVSPAGVQVACRCQIRPRRSFRCRSTLPCDVSGSGRVGGAGGRPTIRAGIVSPAGVQSWRQHLRPRRSFHCQSTLPCDRLGQRVRWSCWWPSRCHRCIRSADPILPEAYRSAFAAAIGRSPHLVLAPVGCSQDSNGSLRHLRR